ncbi:MAG: SDR family oxidoreductase [Gammaproteobacteria bacterium]|nr:SDR family oxidoreductase [Gammaproteobacteria bacterium]
MSQLPVVLITGGSRGLGAGFVESFLAAGYPVATCARSRSERVDAWEKDPSTRDRFFFAPLDLTDREATSKFLREAVSSLGSDILILVNNAGIAREGLLPLLRDDDIDSLIALNLTATVHLTKKVIRPMLVHGWGRVINISSVVGRSGYRGLTVYGATKAALDGITRALARELGPKKITVNSIAPGYLRTEMTHGLTPANMDQIVRRTPVGRLGEVEDVAHLALFLCTEHAAFITGQTLVVDGGITS